MGAERAALMTLLGWIGAGLIGVFVLFLLASVLVQALGGRRGRHADKRVIW